MPFYFRKTISAGPFRFNLSGSGVGFSVGVKGLRFGTSPRGHYVRAGVGGFSYRATFEPSKKNNRAESLPDQPPRPGERAPKSYSEPSVQIIEVSSGSVLAMQDERYQEILSELNAKQREMSLATMLSLLGAAAGVLSMIWLGVIGGVIAFLLAAIGMGVGGRIDDSRRSVVILYDLEPSTAQAYEKVTQSFDALRGCAGKWHIDAGGVIHDIHAWKRNAGASHLVDKRVTTFDYELPRVLKSNITPPMMAVGKEKLYFLPDLMLVVHDDKVGAVAYDALQIRWQTSRFIEEGAVPPDAHIVGQTWKHPNKNGGPDRRFANNHQIPICLYESIHLTSRNGLNELVEVSRTGMAEPFASSINALVDVTGAIENRFALPYL
jgi:hypothetical protein